MVLTKFLRKKKPAFTLIELLVVIAIIGVLAALSLLGYQTIRQRVYDAQRKSDANKLGKAMLAYSFDNNDKYYPSNGTGRGPESLNKDKNTGKELLRGGFIDNIPTDPQSHESYTYLTNRDYTDIKNKSADKFCIQSKLVTDNKNLWVGDQNATGDLNTTITDKKIYDCIAIDPAIAALMNQPPVWYNRSFIFAEKIPGRPDSVKIRWGKASDLTYPIYTILRYGTGSLWNGGDLKPDYDNCPIDSKTRHRTECPEGYTETARLSGQEYIISGLDSSKTYLVSAYPIDTDNNRGLRTDFVKVNLNLNKPPVWAPDAVFNICTNVKCDPGTKWIPRTNRGHIYPPLPDMKITDTIPNEVRIYLKGVRGINFLDPGDDPFTVKYYNGDDAIQHVMIQYRKTGESTWKDLYLRMAYGNGDFNIGGFFILYEGTYDFQIKIIDQQGNSAYLTDSDNNKVIKSSYGVTGQPEGADIEPPSMPLIRSETFTPCSYRNNRTGETYTKAKLVWSPMEDNVALDHYDVSINFEYFTKNPYDSTGTFVGAPKKKVHIERQSLYNSIDFNLDPDMSWYNFQIEFDTTIKATDTSGNTSIWQTWPGTFSFSIWCSIVPLP